MQKDQESGDDGEVPREKLLWDICNYILNGRRAATLPSDTELQVGRHPDMNYIEGPEQYIKMAAIIHRRPATIGQIAAEAGLDFGQAGDLVFAVHTGGQLGTNRHRYLAT